MKQGENGEFKDIADYLYYIPRDDFEYSVSYAVFIKDKQIDDIYPKIHINGLISECISNPILPNGLELTDICAIHGIPKSISEKKSYIIRGKLNNGKILETAIQMSVIDYIIPQGIHLVDLDNIDVVYYDSFNLTLGKESHLSIEVNNGLISNYEIENMIDDYIFNNITGVLTITPRKLLNNHEIIINGYYENSEIPIIKTMSINVITYECLENEKLVFFKLDAKQNPIDRTIVYQFKNLDLSPITDELEIPPGKISDYSQSICLIPGGYKLYIYDYHSYMHHVSIFANGILVDNITMKRFENDIFDINTEIKGPMLEYDMKRNDYYINDIIQIIPKTKFVLSCEISPKLPSCLSFNTSSCIITGKVNETLPETQYTIKAIGMNGITLRYLNLTLYNGNTCFKQQKSIITVIINTDQLRCYPDHWEYKLYKDINESKDNIIPLIDLNGNDEGWLKSSSYEYNYCIDEDIYRSLYIDNYGTGYDNGYIDVLVNGIPVTRRSLIENEKEGIDGFNAISDYNYNTKWEYSSEYEDGWDNIDKTSGLWKETKLSEIESITGNVVYIRKINTFNHTDKYNAFALKVNYISGIIIKVNGKEIFRNNLPDGEITPSTMANNTYDSLTDEIFILPITWLEEEKVIITIELHKYENETIFPQINSYLLRIIGSEKDCLILNKYTNPVNETNIESSTSYYIARYGFDENHHSEWYGKNIPGWVIMRFKEHFHSYFNQFSIDVNDYTVNCPKDFSLEGYDNDNHWNNIVNYEGITYPENERRVFTNYNLSNIYSTIRMNITKVDDNRNYIYVYDINFNLCNLRYCKEVNNLLPKTLTGVEINIPCNNQSLTGERIFYCGNDMKWIELFSTCEEKPSIIYQESEYILKAGYYYNDISLFTISGNNITYSMTPEIEGLKLNDKSGLISGRAYKEQKEKTYQFIISKNDLLDEITIEIKITVIPSERPILVSKNQTNALEVGNYYNDLKLFDVTGKNIIYSVNNLPNGFIMDKNTGLISGMSFNELTMECTVTAKNQYEINFNISIRIMYKYLDPIVIKHDEEITIIIDREYYYLQPFRCNMDFISYSVQPKLPFNLTIYNDTGLISGRTKVIEPSDKNYTFRCYSGKYESKRNVTIHFQYSEEPAIISNIDFLTIEGGKEYDNITLGRIIGNNLLYKIYPSLPSSETLKFNTSTGIISGFITSFFEPKKLTVIIIGSGKQVSFSFTLSSKIPNIPMIITSTKKSKMKFIFGDIIKSAYLFIASGTNLEITVNPDLPKGLILDSKTGEIYGLISKYVDKRNYTFVIKNLPSTIVETVEVEIELNIIYCEADSGFPKSAADKRGREISIKCGGIKNGKKIRNCKLSDENKGIWSEIDDNDCKINSGAVVGISICCVFVGIMIILIVIFYLLKLGIFRKKIRSTSLVNNERII